MKLLLAAVLMCASSVAYANEWVPYRSYPVAPAAPIMPVQPQAIQYPSVAVPVVVPLWIPFVPVVTYDSVMVEHKQWCLFKRYEIVNVPRLHYVPIRY